MNKINNKGFSIIELFLIALVIIIILSVGWLVWGKRTQKQSSSPSAASSTWVSVNGSNLINASGKTIRLLGVDASGTENTCMKSGFSTGPLDAAEANGIKSWHINAVRIPLNEDCWLGINGAPAAYSGKNYQNAIQKWVTALNNVGITAILDLHHSAPGTYQALSQWPMADEDHSPTFWSQVAGDYASNRGVIFDLYNEPYLGDTTPSSSDWSCWLNGCINSTPTLGLHSVVHYQTAGMQQLVKVVRATGAKQPILLGGLHYSGDPCGLSDSDYVAGSCMEIADLPHDPLNQLIIGFHNYNNPKSYCTSVSCWNTIAQATASARIPLLTGEFGEKDCSAVYMNKYMDWADSRNISYLAWSWNVNKSASCVSNSNPTNKGNLNIDGSNHSLISNWSGTPTTITPDGVAFHAHLAMPSVYSTE